MKIKDSIYIIVFSFFFVSCIPNKDLIYLQQTEKTNKSNEVNEVVSKPYRVQTNDILSISIKALDQKLVDILARSFRQAP